MNSRRIVLLTTCLAVAGLGLWLTVTKWDSASKIALVVSTLASVAAVGVALWAAWPSSRPASGARASRTGKALARGSGSATSGIVAPVQEAPGLLEADRTGDADARAGGEATSGIRLEGHESKRGKSQPGDGGPN